MAVAQVSTAAAASANSGGIIQPSKACPLQWQCSAGNDCKSTAKGQRKQSAR